MKQALLVFYSWGTFKRMSDIKEEEIKILLMMWMYFAKFLPKEDFPRANLVSLAFASYFLVFLSKYKGLNIDLTHLLYKESSPLHHRCPPEICSIHMSSDGSWYLDCSCQEIITALSRFAKEMQGIYLHCWNCFCLTCGGTADRLQMNAIQIVNERFTLNNWP